MLLAPALEGSAQVILDCSGVRRRGAAEGIQINHEEKLPLSSIQPLPPTVLHHCWCQTVNLQAQHFTKPLEHQLSLSHATSAPQKKPAEPPGVTQLLPFPRQVGSLSKTAWIFIFRQVRCSITLLQHDAESTEVTRGCRGAALGALKCATCLAREAVHSW